MPAGVSAAHGRSVFAAIPRGPTRLASGTALVYYWCTRGFEAPETRCSFGGLPLSYAVIRSGRCWFRTSDLCRVKATLARSPPFAGIGFRHSQAEYFDNLAVSVRHRSPRLSSNCRQLSLLPRLPEQGQTFFVKGCGALGATSHNVQCDPRC